MSNESGSSTMDTDSYVLVDPPSPKSSSAQNSGNGEQRTFCRFYQEGKCRFGDDCWNIHEVDPDYTPPKPKSKPVSSKMKSEDEVIICPNCHKDTKKLRTVMDVINRIQWDEQYDPREFVVGYLDRFEGIVEEEFNMFDWRDVTTVDDYESFCIPKHRVKYIKQNGVIVWDRRTGVDTIFKRKTRGNECKLCGKE